MVAAYCSGMSASGQADQGRPRFPALDPEPDPRPWWWRVLVGAGVVAAAGAVAVAVTFWPFSSGAPRPGLATVPSEVQTAADRGRIVALDRAGYLLLADAGGTRVVKLSALGVNHGTSASLDGRYLSLGNGQVAVVRNGATLAGYRAKVPVSSFTIPAYPDSFANDDRDLIMLASNGLADSADSPVSVVSVASGMSRSLGVADSAEGDPKAAGVFVSVAAGLVASASVQQLSPDSRVELRDVGRPVVVLATARGLDRELGLGRNFAVALTPYPDAAGDKIAVEVSPISGSAAGIVVLDRTGRVLGAARTPFGVYGIPAWSPSGASLAYASTGNDGAGVFIWTIGGQNVERPFPPTASGGGGFGECIWSPDGKSLLCDAGAPGQLYWVVVRASGGAAAAPVNAPGVPLAWLPGGGGR
jgi:hypothetical protein